MLPLFVSSLNTHTWPLPFHGTTLRFQKPKEGLQEDVAFTVNEHQKNLHTACVASPYNIPALSRHIRLLLRCCIAEKIKHFLLLLLLFFRIHCFLIRDTPQLVGRSKFIFIRAVRGGPPCDCEHACVQVQDTDGSFLPRGPVTSSDSVELWVVALGSHCCQPAWGEVIVSHLSDTHTHTYTHTFSSWTAGLLTFSSSGENRESESWNETRRHDGIKRVSVRQFPASKLPLSPAQRWRYLSVFLSSAFTFNAAWIFL